MRPGPTCRGIGPGPESELLMPRIPQSAGAGPSQPASPAVDRDELRRALAVLVDPAHPVELRRLAPRHRSVVLAGDDLDGLVAAAEELGGVSVYYSLNPVALAVGSKRPAKDEDIFSRRWLLVDVDRAKGDRPDDPATDAEKAATEAVAAGVVEWLASQGWPPPAQVDSGNGYHLLYPIDLPNDDQSRDLVSWFLTALAERFDTDEAKVDTVVCNASRIARLPGTLNRRGTASADRPYRMARLVAAPAGREITRITAEAICAVIRRHSGLERPAVAPEPTPPRQVYGEGASLPNPFLGRVVSERAERYVDAAVQNETSRVASAAPGSRNNTLNEAAFNLGQLVGGGLLGDEAARSALHAAARSAGLGEAESAATIRSGIEAGMAKPRVLPPEEENQLPAQGQTAESAGWRLAPIPSSEFAVADYREEWLIDRLLVADEPIVLGGPQKTLKTSVAVDLAVSLGSGTPFLGRFPVPRLVRTLVLSGESGKGTIQRTARLVCASRGVDLRDLHVDWQFETPRLSDPTHLATLQAGLREGGYRVAVIDPLYLCLIGGNEKVDPANLYAMGPRLLDVARACLRAGCTPLLIHHATKSSGRTYSPLQLSDLSYGGIAEFARQWILLSRRREYQGAPPHRLWMVTGGSAGHSGEWGLDIDDGILGEDFGGRRWEVQVIPGAQARAERKTSPGGDQDPLELKAQEDESRLLQAIDKLAPGGGIAGYTEAMGKAGLRHERMLTIVQRLVQAKVVREIPNGYLATVGNGATRRAKGIQRVPDITDEAAF